MKTAYGKIFLIPNVLSADCADDFLPQMVGRLVHHIQHFVVESEKPARALIKRLKLEHSQQELRFWILDEHHASADTESLLDALKDGFDAGLISDAGLPCIADPGSTLVALAHRKGIEVIPLPGASSMMTTLMGSGMNGQRFAFQGYLPIEKPQRVKQIKQMEVTALGGFTQIFMETPYRNGSLLTDLIATCAGSTKLCIGCEVTSATGFVLTKTLADWKKALPEIHKRPCIFVLGA